MTKTAFALAAVLLAGTALTSAANAGGVRVGFGFPLGSFVAHSNQSYGGDGYNRGRHCDKPRYAARRRHLAASNTPARKIKRAQKSQVASSSSKPVAKTLKLEGRLASNETRTTEIAKTSTADTSTTQSTASTSTTTAVLDKEPASSGTTTTFAAAKTEVAKDEKVATPKITTTSAGPDVKKTSVVTEAKRVCRRFSAAIAGLVDVPCQ
jgi:hypothetical protein